MSVAAARPGRPAARLTTNSAIRAVQGAFVAVLVYGAVTTSGFVTVANLRATLASMAFVGIIAVGLTAIVLSGSLVSLTLGTTTAVSSMLFLATLRYGTASAFAITLVAGALIGAAQGWIVGALDGNPIIVSVAAGSLQAGCASWLSADSIIFPPGGGAWKTLAHTILGFPVGVYVLLVLAALTTLLLRHTTLGRQIYLVGDNRRAARAAGLPVTTVMVAVFAFACTCAALAGVLVGAFSANANLQAQGTYSFDAIAAVLVGGTVITGGRGSAARTVVGALVIAAISNMLLLRGYGVGVRVMVTGVLVLAVVVMLHLRDRRMA